MKKGVDRFLLSKTAAIGLCALFVTLGAAAQSTFKADMPEYIPASPDASVFVKAGVGNTNLSTGALSLSIPLYTIQLKNFSFPISLSYSTQGLKVDEAPSRVGQGWVLNAGGAITRSVRGEPDEFSERLPIPADFLTDDELTHDLFEYYDNASTPGSGFDTQPDEFQYHVNGHSGKFVLNDNMQPRMTSIDNVKLSANITVTPQSTAGDITKITITTPDGVKYLFGTNYEITSDYTFVKYDYYKMVLKTAFFLDRIELPSHEYIDFNYENITTTVVAGATQTLKSSKGLGQEDCGQCELLFASGNYSTTENHVKYITRYLTNITASNGTVVNFNYNDNSDEAGYTMLQDKRLVNLEVVGQKKYSFTYHDVEATNTTLTGRFFLTEVRDITDGHGGEQPAHTFTYNQPDESPFPGHFDQDYLGFFNDSPSNYLIAPGFNSQGVMDYSNRDPNPNAAQVGSLTKVEYPTGGTEEFFFEGNTVTKLTPRDTNDEYELSGPGDGTASSPQPVTYSMPSFTVPFDQTVELKLSVYDASELDGFTADPDHKTASIWVYEGSVIKGSRSVTGYESSSSTFELLEGHTYELRLKVESITEVAFGSLIYNTSETVIYDPVQKTVPGIRVREVRLTDPFTGSTNSKYYTYSSLEHLGQSSGETLFVDFEIHGTHKNFCGNFLQFETECETIFYSSSTTNSAYRYAGSGSPIYYETVIESDDPNFLNGGTEYTFYENDDGGNKQLILGRDISFIPGGVHPTLSGTLFKKRIFDRDKEILRVEQDDYEAQTYLTGMPVGIYIRKNWEPILTRPDRLDAFDVARIQYGGYWYQLKTKTITDYSSGVAMVNKTDYTYGTAVNILPATITTTDSKNEEIRTELKYPTMYVEEPGGDPALVNTHHGIMVDKNQITSPIQETVFRNGVLQQQKRSLYKFWGTAVIGLGNVQLKRSSSDVLHDELIFNNYDSRGNALHLQKANDLSMVYVWDSLINQPIAEIHNALPDQVAYTSFENSALGHWSIVSGGSVGATSPYTGSSNYTGSITKDISTSGTFSYIVTLWTSSSTVPTANSQSGTKVRSANGFDLYMWIIPITNSGTITVTGTQIDEVRMYPLGAQMQSFTYKPFVGQTSKNDPNNRVTFFAYDTLNRLDHIKDMDGNVVKTFEYHYKD